MIKSYPLFLVNKEGLRELGIQRLDDDSLYKMARTKQAARKSGAAKRISVVYHGYGNFSVEFKYLRSRLRDRSSYFRKYIKSAGCNKNTSERYHLSRCSEMCISVLRYLHNPQKYKIEQDCRRHCHRSGNFSSDELQKLYEEFEHFGLSEHLDDLDLQALIDDSMLGQDAWESVS